MSGTSPVEQTSVHGATNGSCILNLSNDVHPRVDGGTGYTGRPYGSISGRLVNQIALSRSSSSH